MEEVNNNLKEGQGGGKAPAVVPAANPAKPPPAALGTQIQWLGS